MRKPRLYYRVPEKHDQKYIYTADITLVSQELFTLQEVVLNQIPISFLIPVMISPDNTYICFGCRFESET